jgi:hypothetical protein
MMERVISRILFQIGGFHFCWIVITNVAKPSTSSFFNSSSAPPSS